MGSSVSDLTVVGLSLNMADALPWTFSFFLLLLPISSDAVTQSCFVCSGDTSDSSRSSILCTGGEHEATKAACTAPNNHGCQVKASEAAGAGGGQILWEQSCCSEDSCQEQSSAQNKIFVQRCTTDDCNFMDPSNGVLPHDPDEEVPEEEIALHTSPCEVNYHMIGPPRVETDRRSCQEISKDTVIAGGP